MRKQKKLTSAQKRKKARQEKQKKALAEGRKKTAALVVLIIILLMGGTFLVLEPIQYLGIEQQKAVERTLTYEGFHEEWHRKYRTEDYILNFQEDILKIQGSCTSWELEEQLRLLPKNTPVTVLLHPKNDYIMQLQTQEDVLLEFEYAARKMTTRACLDMGLGVLVYGLAAFLILARRYLLR